MTSDVVLTLGWPEIAGSGFALTMAFLALVERLRRTFATRADLNGVGERFTALESLYLQVREAADEARERVGSVELAQKHQWERVAELVIRPLEKITDKLEVVGEAQAAHAVALENILQRLDRIDEVPAKPTNRRRHA
jgi:hypothetical protein